MRFDEPGFPSFPDPAGDRMTDPYPYKHVIPEDLSTPRLIATTPHWRVSAKDNVRGGSSGEHRTMEGAFRALEVILGYYWTGSSDTATGVSDQSLAWEPIPETLASAIQAAGRDVPAGATCITCITVRTPPGYPDGLVTFVPAGHDVHMPCREVTAEVSAVVAAGE